MSEVNTVDIADATGTTRTVATLSLAMRTEDAAAESDPRGTPIIGVRRDTLSTSEVSADGDYVAIKADSRGALHVAISAAAGSIGKAEDAAHSSADVGVMALSVRSDTAAATSGTDGDYQPLITDSTGRLHVNIVAAASSIAKAEDAAHSSADVGVMALSVRSDTAAATSGTDGDYQPLITDASGRLHASIAGNLYTEDAAAASDPVGPALIAVRRDTLSTSEVSADGDNVALKADSRGALHVAVSAAAASIGKAEDAAHSSGDVGVMMLSVRADAAAASAGTDGDYQAVTTDASGRLRTNIHSSATSIAKDEDAASTSADTGAAILVVQKAAPTNLAGTDADYAFPQMSDGRLWVSGDINIVQAASSTITRPADTTAYTSGDLVANSVTAGSVAALQFTTLARTSGGGGEVTGVTIQKSTNVITNVALRVHLFDTIPTFTSAGDNSAISSVVVAADKGYLGYVDITTFVAFSDVAWGSGAVDNSRGSLAYKATAQIIYGIVEARGAFAPGNAEVFTIRLHARQN